MINHTASLVWITPKAEATMAFIARVSNPKNQNSESLKLLEYCIRKNHWSVFEQAYACFAIETNRAISPQILRHRSFTFQEFSQRYSAVITEYKHLPDQRLAGATNRQSSLPLDPDNITNEQMMALTDADGAIAFAYECYDNLLDAGFAAETARFVLPLSAPTKLYMTGSIRSWLHYVELRSQPDTQLEHQLIAKAIGEILAEEIPVTYKAWLNTQDARQ
jgi:thymidylate synthase (FAD)